MTLEALVKRTLALPRWAGAANLIWAARLVEPNVRLYMGLRIYSQIVDEALRLAERLTVTGGNIPAAPLNLPNEVARLPTAVAEAARATWEESASPDTDTLLAPYAYAASNAATAAAHVLRTIQYSPEEFRPENVRRTLDACLSSSADYASSGWHASYATVKTAEESGRQQFISQVESELELLEKATVDNHWQDSDGIPWRLFCADNPFVEEATPASYDAAFISYTHADTTFAHRLYRALRRAGVECWLDEHEMRPGDRILDAIDTAIGRSQKLLLCCSANSLQSWWVKDEIRKAQEWERRNNTNMIVPLLLDRFLLDEWSDGLAADLRSRLAVDFIGWEKGNSQFKMALDRTLNALRKNSK